MLPKVTSLNEYGGPLKNYSPVLDPTVDEGAVYRNRYATDVAAMSHTAARAITSFLTANGANPTDPLTGFIHDATWGNLSGVKPAIVRFGEGIWDLTYPATVDTALAGQAESEGGGASATINVFFRRAKAAVECVDGTLRHATAEITGANTVRVRTFLANGTADDIPGCVVTVWVY